MLPNRMKSHRRMFRDLKSKMLLCTKYQCGRCAMKKKDGTNRKQYQQTINNQRIRKKKRKKRTPHTASSPMWRKPMPMPVFNNKAEREKDFTWMRRSARAWGCSFTIRIDQIIAMTKSKCSASADGGHAHKKYEPCVYDNDKFRKFHWLCFNVIYKVPVPDARCRCPMPMTAHLIDYVSINDGYVRSMCC